jgi:hypothetical protein
VENENESSYAPQSEALKSRLEEVRAQLRQQQQVEAEVVDVQAQPVPES